MPLSLQLLIKSLLQRLKIQKVRPRRRPQLLLEQLESRMLLSADVTAYHQAIPGTSSPSTINAGVNSSETILTPANVNSTAFGKLFSTTVDGQVYAQPLYMESITITAGGGQGTHNVVLVATEHDSLYAIDSTTGAILWHDALLTPEHGGTVTSVPSSVVGSGDISPEIGITATPVIDPTANTIYVENKTQEVASNGTHFEHHLYAIDLQSGGIINDVLIADSIGDTYVSGPSVAGTGAGAIGGVIHFDALRQMDRPGLTLVNGNLFLAYASHGDNGPYHGWILGYSESTLQSTAVFNANPNGYDDGIWQGGGSLAYETVGGNTFLYFETGNGSFDTSLVQSPFNSNLMIPSGGDYGDSFVKVEVDGSTAAGGSLDATNNINGWGLHVADYFTPTNEGNLSNGDTDLGSGGPLLLPASAGSAAHPNLMIGSGKEGRLYLMDRNNMGGYGGDAAGDGNSGTDHVVQETTTGAINGSLDTPTFYNGVLYYVGGYGDAGRTFNISGGSMSTNSVTQSVDGYPFPGSTPTISTNPGGGNAIVWDIGGPGTNQLRAYDASHGYGTEIYTSAQAAASRDTLGTAVKFTVPTVADGEVFVGTTNSVVAYGLLQPATLPPAAPTSLSAAAFSGNIINLSWTRNDTYPNTATGYNIFQSTNGTDFVQVATASAGSTSYSVGGLQLTTQYWYEVSASNGQGTSALTNIATATTNNEASTLDFSNGFAGSQGVLTYNGSATLNGPSAQLTDTGNGEAGSVFSTDAVDVSQFSTEFTFQLTDAQADGFTFTIQGNGPTSLGGGGGDLGYQGIPNSVAVKFDLYNNAGEGTDSTGEYTNGVDPFTPAIDLTGTGIQLNSGDVFQVVMAYDGTSLQVTITDTTTNASASQAYTVNIPQIVGGDAAYVGFTGGTGGLTAIQDILTWAYSPIATTPPAAPSDLTGAVISGSEVDVSWTDHSNNETSFLIDRSTDGTNFTQIAAVGANITTYHDTSLAPGETVYYEVQAANAAGSSTFTNVFQAFTEIPPTPPSNVVATNITTTEVDLAWTNEADNASGLKILSKLGNNTARVVATGLAPTTTSYKITGLTPGTAYVFEIDALNSSGPSGAASIAVDTLPGQVTGVTATAGSGDILINWAVAPGAQSYNIYKSTSPTEGSVPTWTGVSDNSFADYSVTPGTTYYYQITAVDPNAASAGPNPANTSGESAPSSEVSALALVPGIDFSGGFTGATGLTLNGGATINGSNLQLTDGGGGEARSVFDNTPQYIGSFSTQFTFQMSPGSNPMADGLTITIQGNSPAALGPSGGGLGYGPDNTGGGNGIPNSVAIKFDLYDNQGEGVDSTGLYADGVAPTNIGSLDLTGAIDLHSGDAMLVTLTYAGSNLTETIHDTVTGGSFTTTYTGLNLASIVGGSTAYVGFTAGTGGLTAVQSIQSWTFTPANVNTFNPPTNLVGVVQDGPQVQLTWDDNSISATSFTIQRTTDAAFSQNVTDFSLTAVAAPTATWVDTSVIPGNTYFYRVEAVNGSATTAFSNPQSAVIPTPPATPSGGHATLITSTEVDLAWTNHATNADEYKIFREVVGNAFSLIATLPSTATSYDDTGLSPGTNYDYHIEAWNVSGAADRTGANLWTVSPAMASLVNTAANGQITLSWSAPAGPASPLLTYNVYRGTSPGGENAAPIATGLTSTSFTDVSAAVGTKYYYEVTSVDTFSIPTPASAPFGESALSNEVTGVISVAPSQLAILQAPTAGITSTVLAPAVQVAVEDQFGNVVTTNSSTVTLTLSSGTFSTGSKTATAVASSGIATFSNLMINTVGNYTLAASDGALTSVTSGKITITGPATKLVYTQAPPAAGIAGVALSPAVTVAVEDKSGNVVLADNSTVTLTLNTGTFAGGGTTATVQAVNGLATFSGLTINKSGNYNLAASDGILTKVTSGNVAVAPAAATQLVAQQTPPATGTAGTAFTPSVKIAVEDQFGNVVTSDKSAVTMTLSGGTFSSGSSTATVAANSGVATLSLTINKAGTYSLSAGDGSLTGISFGNITVNPAAASKLVYQQAPPATGTAGVALNPAVTVAVEDKFGNVIVSDNSTITLTLSTGTFAGGATTATAQAANGIATFNSLKINKSGSYTLAATDGTLSKTTSANIAISPAAASQLVFQQTPPAAGTAGALFNPAVKVAVEDAFGNVVASDKSTVTVTLSGGTFSTGSSTATAVASSGVATFSLAINKVGTYSLAASDGSLTGISSGNITISPAAASKLVYQQAPPATGTAGVALSPAVTVAVEDKFGNVIASDNSTITLTLSAGTFAGGGTTVTAQAVNGVVTFSSLTINKTGTYTLAASDGILTKATSSNLTISPAAAAQLVFQQAPPATGVAGTAFPAINVAVKDQFGNVVTSDKSTVTLTLSSGKFSSGSSTVTAVASNGIAAFYSLAINTAGTYSLAASDGMLTGASSANITISPAAAKKLAFLQTPPATGTAGVVLSPAVTVAVEDSFGNVITTDSSTITLTLNTGTFVGGGTTVSVQAVNGVATFSSLALNKAGSYTLAASDGSLTKVTSSTIVIV